MSDSDSSVIAISGTGSAYSYARRFAIRGYSGMSSRARRRQRLQSLNHALHVTLIIEINKCNVLPITGLPSSEPQFFDLLLARTRPQSWMCDLEFLATTNQVRELCFDSEHCCEH